MSVGERHRREREERRRAILAAAARVFARHGLEGATIEMVAREAEVAVGTIYLYFASRDDLFLSLTVARVGELRACYEEIQARGLEPLAELHAIAQAYLGYLRESRELFLAQQSVVYSQLRKRLRRAAELKTFEHVMDLVHAVWELYERTVRRAFDAGLIANAMGPKKTAAVIWASINGAFMLLGDDNLFGKITGLNPEHFLEETLEAHLAASQPVVAHRNGDCTAAKGAKSTPLGAPRASRSRNGESKTLGTGASGSAQSAGMSAGQKERDS
jgi:AcrR family transcriptional regulator